MFSLSYLDDKQQFIMLVVGIHKKPYIIQKKKNNDENNNNNDKRQYVLSKVHVFYEQNDAQNNFTVVRLCHEKSI